ncbi:hypothetical protein XM38_041860 [Halomicronema hongdechloris C2206]|uniref:CHAT domain-containing protein n=1 Tax=Halomicronema hongdechloris C2206 TaxID=1641165 RepID=A0A1Z3HSE4_9CYAN|nr:tetratricopeptide repeat protein [Halomicronema hongdechloris]ASC73224.1 hypothetical protein XM38_041860 [Halomicronema hongdechloris C2206]
MNDGVVSKSILLLAANPKGTGSLRLQEEEREIKERLRLAGYGKVPINSTGATRTRDIQQAMLDFKPQVVHFTGHGSGKDGLAFEDVAGNLKLIGSDALANLFKLFSNHVECVVLNACYSEFQAEAIAQHIDYVIGMNQAIGDRAAIEFSVGFYTALGAGESVEFAYELGCNAIQLEGIPEHLTPVLFAKKIGHEDVENQNLDLRTFPFKQAAEELPKTTESLTAEDFFERGKEKYKAGNYQGAIIDFQEAICLQPDYAKAYRACGLAKSRLEDYEGAIGDYTTAISFQPNNPDLYIDRGKARDQLKDCRDFRGAILDFSEAIHLQPNNFHAYNCRGKVKHHLRKYQEAIEDFNEAIRLRPDYSCNFCDRGRTKDRLEDHQSAIEDLDEAIRLQPACTKAHLARGIAKFQVQDFQGAIADFTEVICLKPSFAFAYEIRGMTKNYFLNENQNRQSAIADYQEAASLYKRKKDIESYCSALEKVKQIERQIEEDRKGFWRWLLS